MAISDNFTKSNTDQCGKSLQMLQDCKNHIQNSQQTSNSTESPNVAESLLMLQKRLLMLHFLEII
jgi:hypothetical protein